MGISRPKLNLTGIGILSKLVIMHYFSDQAGIDARAVKDIDKVVDLKQGIKIAPDLKLRLASEQDANFLGIYPTSMESVIQYSLRHYVLECSLEVDDNSKALGDAYEKIRRMINSGIMGFRLLKPGYIGANVILWVTTRGSDTDASISAEKPGLPRSFLYHYGPRYDLRTDELSELKDLVERISSVDFSARKSLRIVLDRFNRSYEEIENEDRLIDYMISFEALFLEGEGRYQRAVIPVACAMLLGRSHKERQEIKDLLDLAYEIRNRIVHGSDYEGKLRNKDLELEELIADVEDILRASTRKLVLTH